MSSLFINLTVWVSTVFTLTAIVFEVTSAVVAAWLAGRSVPAPAR